MKKNKIIGLCLLVALFLTTSCVTKTNVTFNTDIPGADVYVDGEHIGQTPTTKKLDNAVWKSHDVLIKKPGYKDIYNKVEEEFKIGNVISGIFFGIPWLWSEGPKPQQYFILTPKE